MENGNWGHIMGYTCKETTQRAGSYHYRAIEVVLVKRTKGAASQDRANVLTVENDWDTLSFVKDNMADITANMVRVKSMNSENSAHVEESAELFQRNLEPLFTLISATATDHVLDKLSVSLRKALLLMAMDRYSCDSESMCRALGITKGQLEKELKRCGLLRLEQKAA
jgi:DNA-binding protein Fis